MTTPALFDIKTLEAEVDKEVAEEAMNSAKKRLIAKRQEITRAKRIVRNLTREYDALVLEITDEA